MSALDVQGVAPHDMAAAFWEECVHCVEDYQAALSLRDPSPPHPCLTDTRTMVMRGNQAKLSLIKHPFILPRPVLFYGLVNIQACQTAELAYPDVMAAEIVLLEDNLLKRRLSLAKMAFLQAACECECVECEQSGSSPNPSKSCI